MIDGLNAVYKRYIYQLISKVQLPGSVIFDSQIKMYTGTEKRCKFRSGIQRLSGKRALPK